MSVLCFYAGNLWCFVLLLEPCLTGGYKFEDGSAYVGEWNKNGIRQGLGHILLSDGTRYDGSFNNGVFHGLGVLSFADGAK